MLVKTVIKLNVCMYLVQPEADYLLKIVMKGFSTRESVCTGMCMNHLKQTSSGWSCKMLIPLSHIAMFSAEISKTAQMAAETKF